MYIVEARDKNGAWARMTGDNEPRSYGECREQIEALLAGDPAMTDYRITLLQCYAEQLNVSVVEEFFNLVRAMSNNRT
jgi:hypothetical protein